MTRHRQAPRGFTLIELMIVVAIIGILASIAAPMLRSASLRARATERSTVSRSIVKAVEDLYTASGTVNMTGTWNPAIAPSSGKHPMDWTMANWSVLGQRLRVEGDVYYSYQFVAVDVVGVVPSLTVFARGDLDGDGVVSAKTWTFQRISGAYILVAENPPAGQEDVGTF